MLTIHTLTRIVATDTDALLYQWSDGHSEQHPAGWTGFYRGSTGGHDANGEYERQDGTEMLSATDLVLDCFVANGGAVEAFTPPDDTAANIIGAPENLFGGPTLKEIFDGR